jgi:outer membrane protein assembly factor BamE (lipoprotein component of BamABCDE complex)
MQWRALFLVAVAILTMPACKREFGNRNLAQLKVNMTQKEVESILGSPDRTEKADVELETQRKTMAITKYYYDQNGGTVVVQFQNGRLVSEPAKLKEN